MRAQRRGEEKTTEGEEKSVKIEDKWTATAASSLARFVGGYAWRVVDAFLLIGIRGMEEEAQEKEERERERESGDSERDTKKEDRRFPR